MGVSSQNQRSVDGAKYEGTNYDSDTALAADEDEYYEGDRGPDVRAQLILTDAHLPHAHEPKYVHAARPAAKEHVSDGSPHAQRMMLNFEPEASELPRTENAQAALLSPTRQSSHRGTLHRELQQDPVVETASTRAAATASRPSAAAASILLLSLPDPAAGLQMD